MEDPFATISHQALRMTFDKLLSRGDCDEEKRKKLETALNEFTSQMDKGKAMQVMIAVYSQSEVTDALRESIQAQVPMPMNNLPGGPGPMYPYQQQQRPPYMQGGMMGGIKRSRDDSPAAGYSTPLAGSRMDASGDGLTPGAKQGKLGDDEGTVDGPEEADTLMGAGVNLVQEQEALMLQQRAGRHARALRDVLPRYTEEHVLNPAPLAQLMDRVALRNGLSGVDPGCVQYMELAVEAHMTRLLTAMARAAQQRTDPARQYGGALPTGRQDVANRLKQLGAETATPASFGTDTGGGKDGSDKEKPAPAPSQSPFVFRKLRPVLVRQQHAAEGDLVSLVRALAPGCNLSPPTCITAPGGQQRGSKGEGADGQPVGLGLPDLVAALERDSLLSKHPLLWRLHHRLSQERGQEGGAARAPPGS